MKEDTRYTVTIFDWLGRMVGERTGMKRDEAEQLAESKRPFLGSTYITHEDSKPVFKTRRQTDPFADLRRRYETAGGPRMTNKQIAAAAKRFADDGELDNAVAMLALTR